MAIVSFVEMNERPVVEVVERAAVTIGENNAISERGMQKELSGSAFEKEQPDYTRASRMNHSLMAEMVEGLQFHHISSLRLQRLQAGEYLFSLKNILHHLAKIGASSLQNSKYGYEGDALACNYYHSSEYYVFALRRIII